MQATLKFLPCLDSDARAAALRGMLDIPRAVARELGRTALEAMRGGSYVAASGQRVDWRDGIERAIAAKVSVAPDDALPTGQRRMFPETVVQVANETTLQAGRRLVDRGLRPLALNFANGVSPGGGFLNGARAQEEVLCRSSALYMMLLGDRMYAYHRTRPEPDSSDWIILSPHVPVFRDDAGTALARWWPLDFVTCAAPVASRVGLALSGDLMARRMHRLLDVAAACGYAALVLGAWGCGAFHNDPVRTARDFRALLEGPFRGRFTHVVFAITDWSAERRFLGPFRDVFRTTPAVPVERIDDKAGHGAGSTSDAAAFNLERFVAAQAGTYGAALAELRGGRKRTHWIWYVLPQMRGLGASAMSHDYGIASLAEARAYLAHPVLGARLCECVQAILQHRDTPIEVILGGVDALKYRSCLTLFDRAGGAPSLFRASLRAFYGARECERTLGLL